MGPHDGGMTAKQQLWSERVSAWKASGKTSDAFSEGAEFTGMQLRHWSSVLRRRRAKERGAKPAGGIRMALVRRGRPKGSKSTTESKPLTLEIGAVRIAVVRGFDREVLTSVLEVLKVGGAR